MIRLLPIVTFLLIGFFPVWGRNPDPDSLRQLLTGADPQHKVELLFMLSESTLSRSPEEAVGYAREGLILAQNLGDLTNMVKAYDIIGKAHYYTGSLSEAIEYFQQGLALAQQGSDSSAVGFLHNSLGVAYKKQGDFQSALIHLYHSLKIWEESGGHPLKTASILSNIASLHFNIKQYEKALELYQRAMPIMEEYDDKRGLSFLYNNLGEVYSAKEDYERAMEFYRRSLSIKEDMRLQARSISTLTNMGLLFSRLNQLDSAQAYYNEALALAERENNPYWLQKLYESQGEISSSMGDFKSARRHFLKSLEAARANGTLPVELEIEEKLAEVNASIGDFEEAYTHTKTAKALRDTLFSEESRNLVANMEAKYQLEQKEQKIQALKRQDQLDKLKEAILIMISLLLILGFFTVYSRLREKKKAAILLKEKNEAIHEKNILLEKRSGEIIQQNRLLKEQSRAIQRQNRLLKQSNTDLEQFAYVASHDLREPLRTIRSYMQLLRQRYKEQLDDSAQAFIGFAYEGAERMDCLLRDLLDYARVGREQRTAQPLQLNGVLERVRYNLDQQISESGAIIEVGELPVISGHEVLMEQLFQNLLSNGIKFRKEGRTPEIRVYSQTYKGKKIISVTDNGIGIDPKYKEKVFTIFQRLYPQDQYPGTGIGLAICKRIAEKHGGELWFESEVGTGTTFHLSLPAPNEAEEASNGVSGVTEKRAESSETALS